MEKKLLSDFQKLLSIEDVLCLKTIVDIDFKSSFEENRIYSPIVVFLETSGKYDDPNRRVVVELRSGLIRCCLTNRGVNSENEIYNVLKSCFVKVSEVISGYREYRAFMKK